MTGAVFDKDLVSRHAPSSFAKATTTGNIEKKVAGWRQGQVGCKLVAGELLAGMFLNPSPLGTSTLTGPFGCGSVSSAAITPELSLYLSFRHSKDAESRPDFDKLVGQDLQHQWHAVFLEFSKGFSLVVKGLQHL